MARPRDPKALRRGPSLHLKLPADELAQAQADAATRGLSLSAHVRDLLQGWRKAGVVRGRRGR